MHILVSSTILVNRPKMYVSLNFIGTRRVRKKFCFPHDYTTVRINMPSFIKIRCLHPLAKVVFTDIRHIQERQ